MARKLPNRSSVPAVPKALLKRQIEFKAEAFPHKDILFNFALRTTGDKDDAHDFAARNFHESIPLLG